VGKPGLRSRVSQQGDAVSDRARVAAERKAYRKQRSKLNRKIIKAIRFNSRKMPRSRTSRQLTRFAGFFAMKVQMWSVTAKRSRTTPHPKKAFLRQRAEFSSTLAPAAWFRFFHATRAAFCHGIAWPCLWCLWVNDRFVRAAFSLVPFPPLPGARLRVLDGKERRRFGCNEDVRMRGCEDARRRM
jgi:hypothetical protein